MLSACLHRSVQRSNIILFFGGSFILLSGRSCSKDVSNRIFDYLGRLSLYRKVEQNAAKYEDKQKKDHLADDDIRFCFVTGTEPKDADR